MSVLVAVSSSFPTSHYQEQQQRIVNTHVEIGRVTQELTYRVRPKTVNEVAAEVEVVVGSGEIAASNNRGIGCLEARAMDSLDH